MATPEQRRPGSPVDERWRSLRPGGEIHGGAGGDTAFGSGDLFGKGGDGSPKATQGEPNTVSCGEGRYRAYTDPALDTVADDCETRDRRAIRDVTPTRTYPKIGPWYHDSGASSARVVGTRCA
ncbi:MAG: hypothetical protein AVDCRST_MAG12-3189 [uncultured Rubrobacteraceae bacterium]|uniref:Uncharacterized protein n=1 Tax=uncultured Rubrobacteraceae bacterium TaxID=349277 RepID=A0A6J4T126_9ACTN|nr:MAG: hypothetical protein AVDCRST_MAG12-3189 [uncultured Rubrobacteraceae bacterium]